MERVAVQIKDQAFSGEEFILVIIFLTEFNLAYNTFPVHEGAAVWLCRELMNVLAFATIKEWSTLSPKSTNRLEGSKGPIPKWLTTI